MGNIATVVKLKKARRQFESAIQLLGAAKRTLKDIKTSDYDDEINRIQYDLVQFVESTKSWTTNASMAHQKIKQTTSDFKSLLEIKTKNLAREISSLEAIIASVEAISRTLSRTEKTKRHL